MASTLRPVEALWPKSLMALKVEAMMLLGHGASTGLKVVALMLLGQCRHRHRELTLSVASRCGYKGLSVGSLHASFDPKGEDPQSS